jgi:hypothetical protein
MMYGLKPVPFNARILQSPYSSKPLPISGIAKCRSFDSLRSLRMTALERIKFLVARGEGQQGYVAGLLDGAGQAALVRGANAGETPGHDLAALGHKPLQQAYVAVRDGIDLLGAELADLFAAEELAASAWAAARATTGTAAGASAGARA